MTSEQRTAPSTNNAGRSSLADEAYQEIRARIVDGRIAPGSRITVRPISDELELSATPIKAALVALERDGVITSRLHRGYFVPHLSASDMREIYELRDAFDATAARLAAQHVEHAETGAILEAMCDDQAARLDEQALDDYRRLDVDFHRALWVRSGNSRLLRAGEPLLDQMLLGNALSARKPGRALESVHEHRGIAVAIAQGDGARAAHLAQEHILNSQRSFEAMLA